MTTQQGSGPGSTVVRWLWIWITLGILVVVVVIGFLIGIVRALQSIDSGLFEASSSVEKIGANADPLPDAIDKINTALVAIDTTLKPIPGQANTIGTGLGSIRDSLVVTDGSLKDTAGSLTNTGGSLVVTSEKLVNVADTSGDIDESLEDTAHILAGVRNKAEEIEDELKDAQSKDSKGTAGIAPRVDKANEVLLGVRADTQAIAGGLMEVNQNLEAICNSPLLSLLPPNGPGQC